MESKRHSVEKKIASVKAVQDVLLNKDMRLSIESFNGGMGLIARVRQVKKTTTIMKAAHPIYTANQMSEDRLLAEITAWILFRFAVKVDSQPNHIKENDFVTIGKK